MLLIKYLLAVRTGCTHLFRKVCDIFKYALRGSQQNKSYGPLIA